MKGKILNQQGTGKEINLPSCFSEKIREDIAQKYFEVNKRQQPYAPYYVAGKQHSASGNIRHGRRKWKTAYGKGISRVPRKIFWRRGTQFYWGGAEISSARGGRRAHPPKIAHFKNMGKINKKERAIAISSALSSTVFPEYIKRRYETLQDKKIDAPYIIESNALKLKTKSFLEFIKKILGESYCVAIKKKVRKSTGRVKKKTAGLLLIAGEKEEKKISGVEVKKVMDLEISDLFPLGRLTIYTEKAIEDLDKLWKGEIEK